MTSPFDFFFMNIWLRRNIAEGSMAVRGITVRDSYVSKCLFNSFVMLALISSAGSILDACRIDISARCGGSGVGSMCVARSFRAREELID